MPSKSQVVALLRSRARRGAAVVVLAAMTQAGCGLLDPESADAAPTADEAVAEVRSVNASIATIRDRYRALPAAGASEARTSERRSAAISPLPPPFELRPAFRGSRGSFAALFGGTAPVEQLPPEYVMPEDVYWSFAVYLEQGRAGEAFDLLDDATQLAVRPRVVEMLEARTRTGDDLSARPTRDLWIEAMRDASPLHVEIVSLRTAMTSTHADVIVTPVSGEEFPVRFVLGSRGWRMSLVPYL